MQFSKLKKVTTAFIYSKNKLLLQLRDEKKGIVYPGCWGLIGGALNKDEVLTVSFTGEKSQFIRYNNAKIRQTGLVDDADIQLKMMINNSKVASL